MPSDGRQVRGWTADLAVGRPIERRVLDRVLPAVALDELVAAGVGVEEDGEVVFVVVVLVVGEVLTAIPRQSWGAEVVYLGADSAYLVEAAWCVAPRGRRAADLGTGAALVAAILASRYGTVVATDILPEVAAAAAISLGLNRRPGQLGTGVCVADVAGGLRPGAFDLVVANAPWVPDAVAAGPVGETFRAGGTHGVELPLRFVREGAELLAPGGVAITLAADVRLRDGRRPLRDACAALERAGLATVLVPTPLGRAWPHLDEFVRGRQPAIADVEHVAVVVVRPGSDGAGPAAPLVAARALGRRWAQRVVAAVSAQPRPSVSARL